MANKRIKEKKDRGVYSLKGSWLWGALLFLLLIFIDQLTKALADVYFNQPNAPETITILPGWIYLRIDYNDGMAYSFGANFSPVVKMCIIAATAVIMAVLCVVYLTVDKRRSLLRLALVFIVAGGVGNLIDRVYYRVWNPTVLGVRDMVDLSRFGFAVCNFADFFITGGAVLLVLAMLFFDKDAAFPIGKKYRALAKEGAEEEKAREEQKQARKSSKSGNN